MKKIGGRFQPETVEELSELVRETKGPVAFGAGSWPNEGWPTPFRRRWHDSVQQGVRARNGEFAFWDADAEAIIDPEAEFTCADLELLSGVLEFEPHDQVVRVGAASRTLKCEGAKFGLHDVLQVVLEEEGQCIPLPGTSWRERSDSLMPDVNGVVGIGLALNFPHCLQAQCGSWRDWVLGMTVVLADGTIVKTGSKAVKSVAGYDVHKLMIGAYDTLGIVVDVTLRTFPLKALPEPDLTWGPAKEKFEGDPRAGWYVWRQRVLPSHYADALAGTGENLLYGDNASFTLWCWLDSSDQELPRYPGDWVVRTGCGEKNVQISDPTQIRFMKRAKAIFDPVGKLNPGEFGFL